MHIGLFLIAALVLCQGASELVDMKIVNDITSYGFNNFAGGDNSKSLVPKVKPSNFSGPAHLEVLKGKCFSLNKEEYKYEFCPFDNVTQHEKSYRWNPYSGILGVWKEWAVVNNTFHGMVMANGDDCGLETREVKVILACGSKNNLTAVEEPVRCRYEMTFKSPLVCHEDSLLVYPRMEEDLRKEWDGIEQQYHDGEITKKGYDIYLHKVLWKGGFVQSVKKRREDEFKPYNSLNDCNAGYQKLLEEVERLRFEKKSKERE